MDVLFIAKDINNEGYNLQKCLEAVDVESLAVQLSSFHGPALTCTYDEILSYVKKSKIIIFMASDYFDVGDLKDKKVFVYHGKKYRDNIERMNAFFNSFVEGTLYGSPDLMRHGAKKEHWISFPVDIKRFGEYRKKEDKDKLLISHFLVNEYKGTDTITLILEKLKNENWDISYKISCVGRNYIENLSKCDIYIEGCITLNNGQDVGEWDRIAVEAAALGKVVVASFLSRDKYEKEFGSCPIQVANTPEELENVLRELIRMDLDKLQKLKENTVEWVSSCHSYEAIGKRLQQAISMD